MSFIGKVQQESSNKKAAVQISANKGRIGVIVRGSRIPVGRLIDVQIGINEDFGKIRIALGTGLACKALGKTGKSVSWSASRAAAKILPELRRVDGTIVLQDETQIIVQINCIGIPTDPATLADPTEDLGL